MNLDYYKAIAVLLNTYLEDKDRSVEDIASGDFEGEIEVTDGTNTAKFTTDWYNEIHRYDEDKPEFWYWQADKNDEYCLFVQGYYDSWNGSTIEDSEVRVGKIGEKVVKYVTFNEVK